MSAAEFEVRQERDEVASSPIVATAVVAFVVGAIGVLVAGIIVSSVAGLRPNAAGPGGTTPAPSEISRIEQTPLRVHHALPSRKVQERRELDRFGWVDRKAGVARIPIARAIDLVVEEQAR